MAENLGNAQSSSPGTNPGASPGAGAPGAPPRPFSRRKRVIIPVVLLVVAAVGALAYWYTYRRGYVSTNDAYVDGNPVTISSKMLGRVTQLTVGTGDAVQAGQLLVHLDDSDLRAQETQATAALAFVEQSVALAKIGVDRARDDFQRAQVQYRDNVITREQYDHARQALEMAEAQYKVALSQVNTSKAQLGVVETQIRNTQIASPISGVVAKKWARPGEIVQPGQPIFTLYDLGDIWITANFEETKLAKIGLNSQVRISVDAYPSREFSGRVLLVGAAAASQFSLIPANNASGNFTKVTQRVPVKISIERPGEEAASSRASLLPGMSTVVKVRVGSK
ncbi:MAG: HlyD family secretion protein [Candidatus Eisenbacteria bacterium]